MDDAALVGVLQRVGDFGGDADRFVEGQRALPRQSLGQRFPLHVAHHIVEEPIHFVGFEQRHNVRVRESGGELDFALEPLAAEVRLRGRGQDLDRYFATEFDVAPEEYGPHPALAELTHQGVAPTQRGRDLREQRFGHPAARLNGSSARRMSSALCHRSSGRFLSARAITAASAGATSGRSVWSDGGS